MSKIQKRNYNVAFAESTKQVTVDNGTYALKIKMGDGFVVDVSNVDDTVTEVHKLPIHIDSFFVRKFPNRFETQHAYSVKLTGEDLVEGWDESEYDQFKAHLADSTKWNVFMQNLFGTSKMHQYVTKSSHQYTVRGILEAAKQANMDPSKPAWRACIYLVSRMLRRFGLVVEGLDHLVVRDRGEHLVQSDFNGMKIACRAANIGHAIDRAILDIEGFELPEDKRMYVGPSWSRLMQVFTRLVADVSLALSREYAFDDVKAAVRAVLLHVDGFASAEWSPLINHPFVQKVARCYNLAMECLESDEVNLKQEYRLLPLPTLLDELQNTLAMSKFYVFASPSDISRRFDMLIANDIISFVPGRSEFQQPQCFEQAGHALAGADIKMLLDRDVVSAALAKLFPLREINAEAQRIHSDVAMLWVQQFTNVGLAGEVGGLYEKLFVAGDKLAAKAYAVEYLSNQGALRITQQAIKVKDPNTGAEIDGVSYNIGCLVRADMLWGQLRASGFSALGRVYHDINAAYLCAIGREYNASMPYVPKNYDVLGVEGKSLHGALISADAAFTGNLMHVGKKVDISVKIAGTTHTESCSVIPVDAYGASDCYAFLPIAHVEYVRNAVSRMRHLIDTAVSVSPDAKKNGTTTEQTVLDHSEFLTARTVAFMYAGLLSAVPAAKDVARAVILKNAKSANGFISRVNATRFTVGDTTAFCEAASAALAEIMGIAYGDECKKELNEVAEYIGKHQASRAILQEQASVMAQSMLS